VLGGVGTVSGFFGGNGTAAIVVPVFIDPTKE
jgi:hypothetical protein